MSIELHCHTTASDGVLSPAELVALAVRRGIRTLAITDHDTTAAVAPARAAARGLRLEVIPAIEISSRKDGREVHILGYFLDPDHAPLQRALESQRSTRLERASRMVARLQDLGAPISMERVREVAGGDTLGRPHLARVLVEQGHVASVEEAFERYLAEGRPAYVSPLKLSSEEAMGLIRDAGGLPVIAHPGLLGDDGLVEELIHSGAGGLEAYYPRHSPLQQQHYLALAARHRLVVTGGSDFHGPGHPDRLGLGEVHLPPEVVPRLRAAARRR